MILVVEYLRLCVLIVSSVTSQTQKGGEVVLMWVKHLLPLLYGFLYCVLNLCVHPLKTKHCVAKVDRAIKPWTEC